MKSIPFIRSLERSRAVQTLLLFGFTSALAFADGSGDISSWSGEFTTLGHGILAVFLALATLGFVGLLIWGALTLATNRPRGLAMIGGGLVGALLCGVSFAAVAGLTGQSVSTSMLLVPGAQQLIG